MNFTKAGAWAEVSDCGKYAIGIVRVNGEFMNEAWRIGKPSVCVLRDADIQKARKACEADAQAAV